MLKIRMQGTKKDIRWFQKLLQRSEEIDPKIPVKL